MSGTVQDPATIFGTELVDNSTFFVTPGMVRNLGESAFAIPVSPNGAKTASYTAAINDRGTVIPFNVAAGSANYTIPPHSSVALPVNSVLGMFWVASGAIAPAFVAGAGVTIGNPASLTLRAIGSFGWAWQYTTNTWYVLGDFA